MTKTEILDACYSVVDANKENFADDDEHRLMIDVSRGLLGIYHNMRASIKAQILLLQIFRLDGQWQVCQGFLTLVLIW